MTSIKFKPILTWMVRTGFCGEVGEEKASGYQGKKAFVTHSERKRAQGVAGRAPSYKWVQVVANTLHSLRAQFSLPLIVAQLLSSL